MRSLESYKCSIANVSAYWILDIYHSPVLYSAGSRVLYQRDNDRLELETMVLQVAGCAGIPLDLDETNYSTGMAQRKRGQQNMGYLSSYYC